MAFNVWQAQGNLFTTDCNPSVIYEGNPQILAGPNVFKMWTGKNNGATGINYYESADGITSWTPSPSNPVIPAAATNSFPTVYKVGSTYYCYHGAFPGGSGIFVRTSANGITWGSATLAIAIGTAGDWESTGVAQLNLVPPLIGPTYYGYYEGVGPGGSKEGLVTSTDLINWTKSPNNPIITNMAPMTFAYVNGTYYFWGVSGYGVSGLGALGFNGLARYSASSPNGPWSPLLYPAVTGRAVLVNHPSIVADFANAHNTGHGCSMQDPCIVAALGNIYMYWTRTDGTDGFQMGTNMSVATGVTMSQLVSGYEGVQGFPLPDTASALNLNTLATDNFTRANANPIGGNWTPIGADATFQSSQIFSNFASPAAGNSKDGDSFYNALSFPNDQWSRNTIHTCTAVNAGTTVRASVGNEYILQYTGTLGVSAGSSLTLYLFPGPGFVLLKQFFPLTVSSNDTLMLAISGSNMLAYYNDLPFLAATNAVLTSGSAGFYNNCLAAAITTSQISLWSGGGFQAAPAAPSLGGSGYMIGSSNRCCSHGLSSQAVF